MKKIINEIQQLQLDLIKQTGYVDNFEGPIIAEDLIANADLWEGVLLTRLNSLLNLRDMKINVWNCDTLYILPTEGKEAELEDLAKNWKADLISWIGGMKAGELLGSSKMKKGKQILQLWWD